MSNVNWLVVGIGDITTKRVIPAIQQEPRSTLYGVVTRDPRKAEPYGTKAWSTLEEALEDPAIDAVYVATPVALHAPQSVAALNASKHVLCEKPVALNYRDAKMMAAAARNAERLLGIAYYRRTYPKVHRAMQLLREGAIGKPVFAFLTAHDWFDGAEEGRGWLLEPSMAGGGPLYDTASHRIDILNFVFGNPVRVTGQRSNSVHFYNVEDSATVLLEYENGVRAVVDVRRHCRRGGDDFRIIGTEGELDLSPLNSARLVHPGGAENIPNHSNLHYPLIVNFVDAVLSGKPLLATGETSLPTDWATEQVMRLGPARAYRPSESSAC